MQFCFSDVGTYICVGHLKQNKKKDEALFCVTFIVTQILQKNDILYAILKYKVSTYLLKRVFCQLVQGSGTFTYSRTCSGKLSQYSYTKLCTPANILPVRERKKEE